MKKTKFDEKNDNINTTYKVPFYGKKGTIKTIKENGNYYIVTRQGLNGEDGEVLATPKKYKKNLMDNYLEDIQEYLDTNSAKYQTAKNNLSKKAFSKNKIVLGTLMATSITTASVLGTIFTTEAVSYAFITTLFFSFIASCHELNELKKYFEEKKNKKFIKEYKNYQEEVNAYRREKGNQNTKNNTHYNGITKEDEKDKIIDIEMKKVLKKNSA